MSERGGGGRQRGGGCAWAVHERAEAGRAWGACIRPPTFPRLQGAKLLDPGGVLETCARYEPVTWHVRGWLRDAV